MKQKRTVECSMAAYGKLEDLVALATGLLATIPAKDRHSVHYDFKGEEEWGDIVVRGDIRYERDETDEEEAARLRDEESHRLSAEKRDRALLARLKAKYEYQGDL